MASPVLYIFAGLPGTGKSTLAKALSSRIHAVYLRIDTLEQGLRDLCSVDVQGEGYRLAYRVAADNLRVGNHVVADSCNPIALTRREWENVAIQQGMNYVNIEVICSDVAEHRRRVERREVEVTGLTLPTWQQVIDREYDPWTSGRMIIDTARRSVDECLNELLRGLEKTHGIWHRVGL